MKTVVNNIYHIKDIEIDAFELWNEVLNNRIVKKVLSESKKFIRNLWRNSKNIINRVWRNSKFTILVALEVSLYLVLFLI